MYYTSFKFIKSRVFREKQKRKLKKIIRNQMKFRNIFYAISAVYRVSFIKHGDNVSHSVDFR